MKITYIDGSVESFDNVNSSSESDHFLELEDVKGKNTFSIGLNQIKKVEYD